MVFITQKTLSSYIKAISELSVRFNKLSSYLNVYLSHACAVKKLL